MDKEFLNINKLKYVIKEVYQLLQKTWSSDAAKLGLPVAAGIQLCWISLTIFVKRCIIFTPGAELFLGLFVIRWK